MKINFKKLNQSGFSHDLAIIGFVLIFAIAGVTYLVASHADTCDRSVSGVSGAIESGPVSSSCPVSTAVSTPVSHPAVASAQCFINAPDRVSAGSVVRSTVTVTNTGNAAIAPSMISFASQPRGTKYLHNVYFNKIKPGSRASLPLDAYIPPAQTGSRLYSLTIYSHSDVNRPGPQASFECSRRVIVTGLATVAVKPASASCQIAGVPAKPRAGQVLRPHLTITNTGGVPFSPQLSAFLQTGVANGYNKGGGEDFTMASLSPGSSAKHSLPAYRVQRQSSTAKFGRYIVASSNPRYSCEAKFTLPVKARPLWLPSWFPFG